MEFSRRRLIDKSHPLCKLVGITYAGLELWHFRSLGVGTRPPAFWLLSCNHTLTLHTDPIQLKPRDSKSEMVWLSFRVGNIFIQLIFQWYIRILSDLESNSFNLSFLWSFWLQLSLEFSRFSSLDFYLGQLCLEKYQYTFDSPFGGGGTMTPDFRYSLIRQL